MQTKEQIKEKVLQMIPQAAEGMAKNLDRVLKKIEYAVNLEKQEDDYILPKLILQALLKEEIFQHKTFYYTDRDEKIMIDKLYALI